MAKKNKKEKKKEKPITVNTDTTPTPATESKDDETDIADNITVPPPTPTSQFDFEVNFQALPFQLPNVEKLDIPVIRKTGIKLCVDTLANYFQCQDYKFNLFQFWFLDVVTDCLWKAQDEFRFPDVLQKTVLSWILFVFDKIRDPQEDLTRKKLFTVFKESILLGAEYIDEGGKQVPLPEKLFMLLPLETEMSDCSSVITSSLSLHSSDKDGESIILFNEKDKAHLFELEKEFCQCNQFDASSVDSITESKFTTSNSDVVEAENNSESSYEDLEIGSGQDLLVEDLKEKFQVVSASNSQILSDAPHCPSDILLSKTKTEKSKSAVKIQSEVDVVFDRSSYHTKMKILTKYLRDVNLNAQKTAAMHDPEQGWVSSEENIRDVNEEEDDCDEDEWVDILDKHEDDFRIVEDQAFINFGVLWAIVDFVFNYFYESFQFTLIKLAFRELPNIICQRVNQEWKTPKVPKGEFIPPPVKKEKKEKKGKKGKEKKEKKPKDKKSKTSKDSKKDKKAKKDKKPKKDKKDKKEKGKKKEKKQKKEKSPKLSKEEKEELERLRREQERLDEERRIKEENKRLMFPLNEAANDDLFKQIFEGWVKVDLSTEKKGKKDKKKGKDKKGKKGKKK